ncbi:YggS family pyridoxal phosphate-dependent enzyme [Vallitalea okinawensis]|uniref:YggS family pyridoxal phosphate-dependent enzyme n=1 Tax=Vallitalea okinawensis TaxID=2078660 RepID=UPI000CFD417E|nr:YggS family pyridoxal phosphate-dependent enzyme [Vallitalea okinawensis]
MEYIKENLDAIVNKIENAAKKSGRCAEDITLLAVTKTLNTDKIQPALDWGIDEVGENKVQEIRDKYDYFNGQAAIHMIGHLQRNKVKYIVDKVKLIHSVDSVRLAEKIDEEAKKKDVIVPVLVQLNPALEKSKFGLTVTELESFLLEIKNLKNIRVMGLMTIAPFVVDPEENRQYFSMMRQLFVDIKHKNIDNIYMEILSMGMTNDYEVAIEEGSTLVRIGTGIFGARDYSKKR